MFTGMRALLMCLVTFGLFLSTPALATDVDDLKATFEKAVKAYNSHDEVFFTMVDDQAVIFNPSTPFAVDGKAAYQPATNSVWAATESVVFSPVNPQYRVIGSTGIAWGHYAISVKPKDGPMETNFGRYTVIFSKSGGKWLAVASHYSAIPSGN